ncbi:MAG: PPOX class F420-dependent oxidoreductase [Microbacteriaceae bacterium]|nr:PPOX class F420-dependent oxidoreductase [Microbacteriaceae bacterium]MCL2795113.1 PPOX class F420-dependent oxidoreductase [Microbacteriaceae bacterium]
MPDLLIPADHLDLVQRPGVVTLTTIGPSGYPQSSAIWFTLGEDGLVRTSLTKVRQKYRNLAARPVASYFWIDPANPYRTLEVRGDVRIEEDTDLSYIRALAARYGTTPEAAGIPLDDRVIVTLLPTRIRTNG